MSYLLVIHIFGAPFKFKGATKIDAICVQTKRKGRNIRIMSDKIDKTQVLERIKGYYDLKTNAKFASFLGVAPTTLSSWYSRSTFDLDVIYSKCAGLSMDWVLTGHGSMLRSDKEHSTSQPVVSLASLAEEPYIYRMYQDQLKVAKEEKEENKVLISENATLKERLRILEERLSNYQDKEPNHSTMIENITETFI